MNMKKNKPVYIICSGLLITLLLGMWWCFYIERQNYSLEVIKLDDNRGYGYIISQGEQTVIYQPFVPVLSQRKPFGSAEEAFRVGDLVLKRLKSGQDFSVTEADLERLKVGNK